MLSLLSSAAMQRLSDFTTTKLVFFNTSHLLETQELLARSLVLLPPMWVQCAIDQDVHAGVVASFHVVMVRYEI